MIDLQDSNFAEYIGKPKTFSIAVFGITSGLTKYSIFVSTHPNLITPIENYSTTISCEANANGFCYFTYKINNGDHDSVIVPLLKFFVFTKYLYGNGIIYAKLLSEKDVNIIEYYGKMPENLDRQADYSSLFQGKENTLKFSCIYY